MNLIDTYVSEVGRHLPEKTRADIEAEIRSTLQDMLEERSQKTGKQVDEDLTVEMLKEYGAPEKVAATYAGERYLIGPGLYPTFMQVLRIVLTVTIVLAVIGMGIKLFQIHLTVANVLNTILTALGDLITSVIGSTGSIIFLFAIIEWAVHRSGEKLELRGLPKEKEWDPRSLAKLSAPNRVKWGEAVGEMIGSVAAIILFNFYPGIIGFTPSLNSVVETGSWNAVTFIPLLSEAFFRFVPYLTAVWALTVVLDIFLLSRGYWTTLTRIFQIGLKVVSIIIAALMLAGPSLFAITTASLTTALGDAQAAGTLMTLLNQIVIVALWISIIGSGIEIIRAIYRLFANPKLVFPLPQKG